MLEINVYNDFLKDMRSVARFDWSGRLFQSLAPLYEILFAHLRSFSLVEHLKNVEIAIHSFIFMLQIAS